jgi:outer membrane protein assembly factor BamB
MSSNREKIQMNYRRGLVTLFMVFSLFWAGQVWGAAGDQLWETEFNCSPYNSKLVLTALSVTQTSLIVCGYAEGSTPGVPPQMGFVKAFDLTTGNLKWQNNLTLGSSSNIYYSISADGGIVLLMGTSYGWVNEPIPSTLSKAVIRAFNADTGEVIWETQKNLYHSNETITTTLYLPFMAAANNRTYLATTVDTNASMRSDKCILSAFQTKNVSVPTSLLLLD